VTSAVIKGESSTGNSEIQHWIESYKALEQDNDRLQRQIKQQEEDKDPGSSSSSNEELLSEIEELKQCLDEKTLEADESVEKYCTLIIKSHQLEEDNDALKKQVDFLSSKVKHLESRKEVTAPERMEIPNASEIPEGKNGRSTHKPEKRRRDLDVSLDTSGQQSPAPQCFAKRIKKTARRPSHEEDEVFELDGLPEVVKKGQKMFG
ncbi:hypothetical protein GDO86_018930, partial [Hymenochirus boettgeri]